MGLMVPLDDMKEWLGIDPADTTHDDALTKWGEVVTTWMENYCNRGLEYIEDYEEDVIYNPRLELFRFPVVSVSELGIGGSIQDVNGLQIDKQRGIIHLSYGWNLWYDGWYSGFTYPFVHVKYTAGFNPIPADLAQAYSYCVAGAVGVSPSISVSGGSAPLRSLSLGSGALSVAFDTALVSGRSGSYDVSNVPPQLQAYASVLDNYKVLVF